MLASPITTLLFVLCTQLPAHTDTSSQRNPSLEQVEAEVCAGRGHQALNMLDRLTKGSKADEADQGRILRLRILADRQMDRFTAVMNHVRELEKIEGWNAYAKNHRVGLTRDSHGLAFWEVLFALAMGIFLLGGGRELLRPHMESVILFGLLLGLVLLSGVITSAYAGPGVIIGILSWALVHGAVATMSRTGVGFRGRLLLGVVLLAGVIGVVGATMSKISHF